MSNENPVVRLHSVHRRYQRGESAVPAVQDVSLELRAGEMVALIGPSGCGKSTTLNIISGVDRADEGEVDVAGHDLVRAEESELVELRRSVIGVVFQAFHLLPNLTVRENVGLPLSLAGRRDDARVQQLIERVGLGHRGDHYPSELSGGEQQRTAVARALVHRPRILIADEPTGNLDSRTGKAILDLLDELRREENTVLLLATHDDEVARRADRVVAMRDGRIEEERRQAEQGQGAPAVEPAGQEAAGEVA